MLVKSWASNPASSVHPSVLPWPRSPPSRSVPCSSDPLARVRRHQRDRRHARGRAVAAAGLGLAIAKFTEVSRTKTVTRQVLFTAVPAALTYAIGSAVGVGV
ncbi:MAG: hypothetical protein R2710_19360 [Acidimicrobiales bacterium]